MLVNRGGGIYRIDSLQPAVNASVFIAEGAIVAGDVTIGPDSSVWFNAVIRGDAAPVRVGARTNIQDGAVLHVDPGYPCLIGDDVTIGHAAIVHGAVVENCATIGMGAIVLTGARIGTGAVVAAGSLVTEGTEVPAGMLAMGSPAKIRREVSIQETGRFAAGTAHYVENARRFRDGIEVNEGAEHGG